MHVDISPPPSAPVNTARERLGILFQRASDMNYVMRVNAYLHPFRRPLLRQMSARLAGSRLLGAALAMDFVGGSNKADHLCVLVHGVSFAISPLRSICLG
jgi:hypothetical protein